MSTSYFRNEFSPNVVGIDLVADFVKTLFVNSIIIFLWYSDK